MDVRERLERCAIAGDRFAGARRPTPERSCVRAREGGCSDHRLRQCPLLAGA